MPWAIDLDGVMWLGDRPIAGSAEAIGRLRDAGELVLFVTNNSSEPVASVEAKLAAHGVEADGDVLTSAVAAATLVEPGARVLVLGGAGIVEAVEARGAVVVTDEAARQQTPDVVMVGFTRGFDFDRLEAASRAVRQGAHLIGTNTDPTYPTPDGQIPGGGAILAAVATASGREPLVAGKPHRPLAELVRDRLGPTGVMVGDRPDTDGAFARALGYRFALVRTGVTDTPADLDPAPDVVADDLAHAVDQVLGVAGGEARV
jgi:HAD superfamily hydrolase (TIGR01450 family)